MGVCQLVGRTGGNQQLVAVVGPRLKGLAGGMLKVGEAPLQSDAQLRVGLAPRAESRQRRDSRQIITGGQIAQNTIGNGRGGFTHRKSRMTATVQKRYPQ